jgi:hypothetical protein
MQTETRHIHIAGDAGRIEPRQNVTQFDHMLYFHAARVVVLMQAFQSFVTN